MLTFMLAAALAARQPVLGPEILSAPQPPTYSVLQPEVGIAADHGNAVVAWAAGDHVYVDLLGIDGHLGVPTDIPASTPVAPSLAPFRGGYLLAWVEKTVPERAIIVRLTAGLQPIQAQTISATTAQLRSDGTYAFLLTGTTAYALTDDAGSNPNIGIYAGDDIAVLGSGTSAHLWHEVVPCGHFNWGCGGTDLYVEVDGPGRMERITAVQTTTGLETIASPAAIAFDGQRLLVACYNVAVDVSHTFGFRGAVQVRPYDAGWLAPPITVGGMWDPSAPVRPGVASDGRRFVIVWRTWNGANYDVAGAIIDNSTLGVTPLDIALGPNDEVEPGVAAIAPGRFLITWTSRSATERRLAARFLDFEETPIRFRPSR